MEHKRVFRWFSWGVVLIIAATVFAPARAMTPAAAAGTAAGLLVTVEATTSYTRTYTWGITQVVSPGNMRMFAGDLATARYTITTSRSQQDSNFRAAGTVRVTNPTTRSYRINGIGDTVRGIPVTLQCSRSFPFTLHKGETVTCTFQASLPDGSPAPSDVTIRTSGVLHDIHFQATITFDQAQVRQVNRTIHVTASIPGAGPWTLTRPGSVSFERDYDCAGGSATYSNTATIQETGQSASAGLDIYCDVLSMQGDANAAFTETFIWSIDKRVDRPSLSLGLGETATVNYEVEPAWVNEYSDFAFYGSGYVQTSSPNPVQINQITFENSLGVPMQATCTEPLPAVISSPLHNSVSCEVEAPLEEPLNGAVTTTIVQQSYHYLPDGSRVESGTVINTFPSEYYFFLHPFWSDNIVTVVGDWVEVNDSYAGDLGRVGARINWTFEYSRVIGPYSTCGTYTVDNTASFAVEGYNPTGSDSQSVAVDVPCE